MTFQDHTGQSPTGGLPPGTEAPDDEEIPGEDPDEQLRPIPPFPGDEPD